MKKIILLAAAVFLVSSPVLARKPVCKTASSGANLMEYTGKVDKLYINSGNLILLYFDEPVSVSEAADCGFTVSYGNAASYRMSDNPEFANVFYSTALAAQASQKEVTIQMYGVKSGYMQFDRIWIPQ